MGLVTITLFSLIIVCVSVIIAIYTTRTPTPSQLSSSTLLLLMVKNEEAILPRILRSALDSKVAKYLFLCDTGSTDGTIRIAQEIWPRDSLMIVSGVIPFVHFEQARNECKQRLAQVINPHQGIEWILLADADFSVGLLNSVRPPEYTVNKLQIRGTPHNSLNLLIHAPTFIHHCKYRLWTHEFLSCSGGPNVTFGSYHDIYFIDHADGKSRPEKLARDVRLLKEWLKVVNETDLRPRALYYLARALEDQGNYNVSLRMYERHYKEESYTNYLFYNRYRIALINYTEENLLSAYNEYDGYFRKEPLYHLARYQRTVKNNLHGCIMYATAGMNTPPIDYARVPLFLEAHIYEWALEEELAYCLTKRGLVKEGRAHYERLLREVGTLDQGARSRIEQELILIKAQGTRFPN